MTEWNLWVITALALAPVVVLVAWYSWRDGRRRRRHQSHVPGGRQIGYGENSASVGHTNWHRNSGSP